MAFSSKQKICFASEQNLRAKQIKEAREIGEQTQLRRSNLRELLKSRFMLNPILTGVDSFGTG
ncbi:hypothetical protein ACSBR1_040864 [Camellia fascicularis]